MKPKIYNRKREKNYMSFFPHLRITTQGRFFLNKRAANDLNLNKGDLVNLVQDEENPRDWYLKKTDDEAGFPLSVQGKHRGVSFSSSTIRNVMFKSLGLPLLSTTFRISNKPIEGGYFPIITSSAKND